MDVKGILDKIEADAREAAAQTLEQAQARIDALRAANDAAQHQQLAAMEEKIKADAAEMEGRMIRMAELEDKKARLAAKREVMDDTFRLAQDKLCTLPDAEKRAFFMAQLLSAADGGEVLCIGRKASGWYGDSFLAEANEKLKAAGKQEPLTRGKDIPGCGFELVKDGSSLNCTFEMLAEGQCMALEGDVARALFDE